MGLITVPYKVGSHVSFLNGWIIIAEWANKQKRFNSTE